MTCQLGTDLFELVDTLAEWSAGADVTIYLFGSRVRGDHLPNSDVDLLIVPEPTNRTTDWQYLQESTQYAAIQSGLPGPIALIDPYDDENRDVVAAIKAGTVVLQNGNVRCIWLEPKPRLSRDFRPRKIR